jgi:copper chaperone CopZ
MARMTLTAPTMFADHHVLQVRQTLAAIEGIQEVYASSAWQAVVVSYDAAKIEPVAIERALAEAGYPSDEQTPVLAQNKERFVDPAWADLGVRTTETNLNDLRMSGDFRKY